jgi:hypothetical protein
MENCVAVTNWDCVAWGQKVETLRNMRLRIRRNTFIASCTLCYGLYGPPAAFIDKRPDRQAPELHLEITENVIDAKGAPWHVAEDKKYQELKDYPPLLPRLFTLKDEHNVYSHPKAPLLMLGSQQQKWLDAIADLGGWNKLWGIKNPTSLEGVARFEGGDLRKKGHEAQLVPADFRLAKDSPGKAKGKDGKDLGADVDRVGPGKPYEEWKKTPDYQKWQKEVEELLRGPQK